MGHKRSVERNKRLKKVYSETKTFCGSGVWFDERKGRYVKISASRKSKRPKYLRNRSNRKIRHYKGALNNSDYKRLFDYWWELY